MESTGHGEVSTGSMIPVHDASNEGDARAVVELLEAHEIPALIDSELEGVIPWRSVSDDAVEVLVPSSMIGKATEVLHRHDYQTLRSKRGGRGLRVRFASSLALPAPASVEVDPIDEEDTGPLQPPLPESSSSLNARLAWTLGGIGFGAALQQIAEATLGARQVVQRFAAKAPVWEEPYRLVTASFLHGSAMHFIMNGIVALLLGLALFDTHLLGATAFVWLVSSAVGLFAESALTPTALIIGASAGNYGLIGLWANGELARAKHALLTRRERLRVLGILILLVPGALTPVTSTGSRVAVAAHVFGFVAGFALGFVFQRRILPSGFDRIAERSRLAMVATAAVVLVAFLFAGLSLT